LGLESNDGFQGEDLDLTSWFPSFLLQWSSRELAATRYNLECVALRLLIEQDQHPWCPDHDGAVQFSSCRPGATRSQLAARSASTGLTRSSQSQNRSPPSRCTHRRMGISKPA
jgi:hypothetical protein